MHSSWTRTRRTPISIKFANTLVPSESTVIAHCIKQTNSPLAVEDLQRVSLYTARLELSTFLVGGGTEGGGMTRPNFDHMQSAFAGIRLQPTNDLRAEMAFNLLGNVAQNPIDEIFYEKRGLPVEVVTADGDTEVLRGLERTKLYSAKIDWEHDWFKIEGYYRTGQYHWGDEGDFFGLFRETYYGPNLDIYDGEAPLSLQFEGRKKLKGLKVAAGPQIFWGANPGFFVKYTRNMGQWNFTYCTTKMSLSKAVPTPQTSFQNNDSPKHTPFTIRSWRMDRRLWRYLGRDAENRTRIYGCTSNRGWAVLH